MYRLICLAALALAPLAAHAADAPKAPAAPNMQAVIDSIRAQRDQALDELAVEKGRGAAQQAAYEARLATAMEWLKTAQNEAAAGRHAH